MNGDFYQWIVIIFLVIMVSVLGYKYNKIKNNLITYTVIPTGSIWYDDDKKYIQPKPIRDVNLIGKGSIVYFYAGNDDFNPSKIIVESINKELKTVYTINYIETGNEIRGYSFELLGLEKNQAGDYGNCFIAKTKPTEIFKKDIIQNEDSGENKSE